MPEQPDYEKNHTKDAVRFFSASGNTTHIIVTFGLPHCGNYADLLEQP
jgi:hypothetical protein